MNNLKFFYVQEKKSNQSINAGSCLYNNCNQVTDIHRYSIVLNLNCLYRSFVWVWWKLF